MHFPYVHINVNAVIVHFYDKEVLFTILYEPFNISTTRVSHMVCINWVCCTCIHSYAALFAGLQFVGSLFSIALSFRILFEIDITQQL